jgi:hypothetical protein
MNEPIVLALCHDGRPHREVRGRPPRQRCAPFPRPATNRISELIRLFDGPAQREAKRLADEALREARGIEEEEPVLTLQIRNLLPRFWAQVVVVGMTGLLYVVTPFRPDWIEAICGGFDPDRHDGSIEWIIVMAMLVVTLAMLGGLPWIKDRP